MNLGRFLPARFTRPGIERFTPAERMRMAFEELGPTFVKLGQLLATRPDLVPTEFVDEFKRLHDQVAPVPFSELQEILEDQFGTTIGEVFLEFDQQPLAAASIAQAHKAILQDGTEVVVKIQRPGIIDIIGDDINILYYIAELLQKFVPEARLFNPVGIVDEFFKTLELETNFILEANNIRRFQENFKNDESVKIPQVFLEYSGRKVLVLEALQGFRLSQPEAMEQEGIDRLKVMQAGVRCYFRQVFKFGLFHGDLHAGNIFILPDNRIGLIDFGIVGRLNRRVQDSVANMFVALYTEDYERLAYEYVELAPYSNQIDVDEFAKDLQDLLAPYFGLSMRNINLGRLLLDSTAIAARYKLVLPTELLLFFKSIVTIEGMGRTIMQDFNLLDHALEFANEIVKSKYEPARIGEEVAIWSRDASELLKTLPRQLKQITRKLNHPEFAFRLSLVELDDMTRSVERASNILFLGLIVGSLILSSSIAMFLEKGPIVFNMPLVSALGYSLAGVIGLVAFYNYIRK
jgi:ubiquinone biosynthesis protein